METQIQNQQEVVTRSELNYLRATDALKTLNTKLEAENSELKKAITAREAQIRNQDATLSSSQSDNNRLRREIETKNDIISDNKYGLAELKTYANRVGELERQISTINRRHESDLDFQKHILKNKDNEIAELKETIEQLENEIEELEEDGTDEESEEVEDGNVLKMEIGGTLDNALEKETYKMPEADDYFENREDYIQRKKEAILHLVDGGEISFKKISELEQAKKNLGGEIKAEPTEKELTEKAILDGIKKGNGRIPESELIKIKGVTLNDGGFVVLAKGGELNLRRSFLHPSFILIPQKP